MDRAHHDRRSAQQRLGRCLSGLGLLLMAAGCGARSAAQDQPPSAAGFQISARLERSPHELPKGVPSVIVHAPSGFDAHKPLQLVVFLHGLRGCVSVLVGAGQVRCGPGAPLEEGWDLATHHDRAHSNTLFVVPQLAYMKRDGRPGRFAQQGGFRAYLQELLSGPLAEPLGGPRSLADVARIDLVAHSAGYQTALAILERGGVEAAKIRSVVLLDSLYAERDRFAQYVEAHRDGLQFVVISVPNQVPAREALVLEKRLRRSIGAKHVTSADPNGIGEAIARYPIVFARGKPPHRLVPANHLSEVLAALHNTRAQ
jgi:hypothetical protein